MHEDIRQKALTERRSAAWDLKNAPKNYLSLVLAQFCGAFFAFASVWLISKKIGSEGYGGVVAVIAASQVAQIFVNWTLVALTRHGVEEFVESGEINKTFWARMLIFLPNTLILLAFSFLWLPLVAGWLKLPSEVYWYIIFHFLVAAFWLHVQHALQGAKLMKLHGMLIALERVLVFAVLAILVLSDRLNYLTAVVVYVLAPLMMSFVGLFRLRKLVSRRIEIDLKWMKTILKFSIPLIPFAILGYVTSNYLDAIFISQFLSKKDLGIYSIAYQINGILMQFPTLAGSLLLPFFVTLQADKNIQKVKLYMEDVLPLLTLAGGLLAICTAIFAGVFLPFILGEQAAQITVVFWILISSTVFIIPGLMGYAPYFNSFSATYIGTIMSVVAAALNFTFNFLLIPRYGLKGSAWATVIAYAASTVTIIFLTNRQFSLKHKWTIPAMLPALVGSAYAAWSENYLVSSILAFLTAVAIVLIYWNLFRHGVRLLLNYRDLVAKQ